MLPESALAVAQAPHRRVSPQPSHRVLIVSPRFPPSSMASVHRARHLAAHLPDHNWAPTILAVDERLHGEDLDPALCRLLPDKVDIIKVGAVSPRLARHFGIGDLGLRSFAALRDGVRAAIASRRPDVVLISGAPFYPLLLAATVKREFGIPVVLDFQDPWVSAWGETLPPLTKGWVSHALAKMLEPKAVAHADFVTSVSDGQNREFLDRYPWFPSDRVAAVPIGGDRADYDLLRRSGETSRPSLFRRDHINICYVGTYLPRAEPVLTAVFRGVASYLAGAGPSASRLRLHFVGTSNQRGDATAKPVQELAERMGLGGLVGEVPGRVPYLDALALLAHADGILLVGSDEQHYTASKIYPALFSGRPSLSVFHRASSSFDILSRARGGLAFGFNGVEELDSLVEPIAGGFRRMVERPEALGVIDRKVADEYDAHNIAARYAAIFDGLLAAPRD